MHIYAYHQGSMQLLISMPHNGIQIPGDIKKNITAEALRLTDTDWHMDKLYDFALEKGASILNPLYSRYVIDLNRDPHGEELYEGTDNTALCPQSTFEWQQIYRTQGPSSQEIRRRLATYYYPYHQKISQWIEDTKKEYGFALIYDAHSIKSILPRFFKGKLPDLNLGPANGQSCLPELEEVIFDHIKDSPYNAVCNGRFKGGYITRHYGDPDNNVFTIQMEIAQSCYLDESTFSIEKNDFLRLQSTLKELFAKIITWIRDYEQV